MDEMNNTPYCYGGGFGSIFAYIILFVIIVWVFGGAFGGFGRNGFGNGFGTGLIDGAALGYGTSNFGFQNFRATCDAEKTEIVNTARTQYLIEQQASATQAAVNAQGNALKERMDFYAIQDLRDKLNERERTISRLESERFTTNSLAPLAAQLAYIQANMLQKPEISGVGVACPSAAILNGFGVNPLNNTAYNNCCCNNGLNSTLV